MRRIAALYAFWLLLAPAAASADGIGVVLMHGKQGFPDENPLAYLSKQIEGAGFPVDRPEMCWSRKQLYDHTLLDCMADIDASIARLKKQGMTSFIIAGHSLGGVGAILYGSLHDGLKGIVALAPAPPPGVANQPVIVTGMQQARGLIAAGHGNDFQTFDNSNNSFRGAITIQVRATPSIFVSFRDMSGPANVVADTAKLKAPVLWVSGSSDPSQMPRQISFDKAPANPLNRYVQINAGHMDTSDKSADAVVAWLKEVAKN